MVLEINKQIKEEERIPTTNIVNLSTISQLKIVSKEIHKEGEIFTSN